MSEVKQPVVAAGKGGGWPGWHTRVKWKRTKIYVTDRWNAEIVLKDFFFVAKN